MKPVAGTYVLRLTGNDSVLSTQDDVQITVNAAASPILRYTFDSTLNNSGSLTGYNLGGVSPSFVTGKFGNAAQFANGQYAFTAGAKTALTGSTAYTISFWYNAASSS